MLYFHFVTHMQAELSFRQRDEVVLPVEVDAQLIRARVQFRSGTGGNMPVREGDIAAFGVHLAERSLLTGIHPPRRKHVTAESDPGSCRAGIAACRIRQEHCLGRLFHP